jgi:Ca2+-binding EF-hand superfamily protein
MQGNRPRAVRVPGMLATIDEPPAMIPGTPPRPSASASRLLPGAMRSPPGAGLRVEDLHGDTAPLPPMLGSGGGGSGAASTLGQEADWELGNGGGNGGGDSHAGMLGKTVSGIQYAVHSAPPTSPTTESAPRLGRFGRKRHVASIQGRDRPMPADVDLSISGIADAWEWYCAADVDGSGEMEFEEFAQLARQVGQKLSNRQLRMAFDDMLTFETKAVKFAEFAQWWARQQAIVRRDMRRTVRELFEQHDKDKSGILDKHEFGQLVLQANKDSTLPMISTMRAKLPPGSSGDGGGGGDSSPRSSGHSSNADFDLELAWEEIRKTPFAGNHEHSLLVFFPLSVFSLFLFFKKLMQRLCLSRFCSWSCAVWSGLVWSEQMALSSALI